MLFWNCTKNATQKMGAINLQAQRKTIKSDAIQTMNAHKGCAATIRGGSTGSFRWQSRENTCSSWCGEGHIGGQAEGAGVRTSAPRQGRFSSPSQLSEGAEQKKVEVQRAGLGWRQVRERGQEQEKEQAAG